jgi:hypothetical protein
MVLLSTAYLPPISYMALLVQHRAGQIEHFEHFAKQSYRNRCTIYGPSGVQSLTVPVDHATKRQPIKDLRISYAENWPDNHWRAMLSAYNNSAFFDVLGDDIRQILNSRPTFLLELNDSFLHVILDWLQDESIEIKPTTGYEANPENDFRNCLHPKHKSLLVTPESYFQPFSAKHGFLPDLSVIDLLFAEGRTAWDYLNESILTTEKRSPSGA